MAEFTSSDVERLSPVLAALRVDEVTAQILRAFGAADVRSILLKGASIARWLYADGSARSYIDTDVLVPPGHRSRAERVLAELGFSPVLGDEDTPGWRLAAHVWVRPDGAEVDLHRTLVGVGADASDVWQTLWGTSEPMRVGGLEVEVLSVPARAFQLALHATQHGRDDGRRLEDLHR